MGFCACIYRSLQVPAAGEENAPPDSDSPTVSATMAGAVGACDPGQMIRGQRDAVYGSPGRQLETVRKEAPRQCFTQILP